MTLDQVLKEFGLEEREIKVYLSLLQQGKSTVLEIAKLSEIKRTTVYDILDDLKDQGLAYIGFEGKKKIWIAQSPKKLEEILKNRYEHMKLVLPELESYWNQSQTKPKVQYYEGVEAIKSLHENTRAEFRSGQDYYIISSSRDWFGLDSKFFQKFVEYRAKIGVKSRFLATKNPKSLEQYKNRIRDKIEMKFLPKNIDFKNNTVIYNNKLIFTLPEEKFAVVIESKLLYDQQKQLFELLWKNLPTPR